MSKTLAKRPLLCLCAASLGAGTIYLTAYLINSNKAITVLNELRLDKRPDIIEEELLPEIIQPPAKPSAKGQNSTQDSAGTGNANPNSSGPGNAGQDQQKPEDSPSAGDSQPESPPSLPSPAEPSGTPDSQASGPSGDPRGGSTDSAAGGPESDPVEIIKSTIKEMNESNWFQTTHQLGSIHSIITRTQKLNAALKEWKKTKDSSGNVD